MSASDLRTSWRLRCGAIRVALVALAPALVTPLAACARERPAHFIDAPAVQDMGDDAPIPLVKWHDPLKETTLTQAYVERPMIEALNPRRAPEAGDVNALDEVPRSSWAWAAHDEPDTLGGANEEPEPPFRMLDVPAVTREHAITVLDARGRRFEIWRDPPDRAEMATGAAAVASHLLRVVGYFTPGVFTSDLALSDFAVGDAKQMAALRAVVAAGPAPWKARFRVALTRWPIGLDVGPTPSSDVRADDPNDRVPHEDRRTLRALKLIFGWLGMTETDASVLRDAYVGEPGRGHLVHFIAGLAGALGADAVVRPIAAKDDDSDLSSRNVWVTLGTLGLYDEKQRLTSRRWPAIGEYRAAWVPAEFHTSPPIAPMDRLLPGDAYWAAKRIARVRTPDIDEAIAAAQYHDPTARAALVDLLRVRQAIAIRWGLSQVTPCEVERLEQGADGGAALILRDEAPTFGISPAAAASFRVELVDASGVRLADPTTLVLSGATIFPVRLPPTAPSYVVVRVWGNRVVSTPRAMEVHLARDPRWKVVGVVR
jgi:hypothetical protein